MAYNAYEEDKKKKETELAQKQAQANAQAKKTWKPAPTIQAPKQNIIQKAQEFVDNRVEDVKDTVQKSVDYVANSDMWQEAKTRQSYVDNYFKPQKVEWLGTVQLGFDEWEAILNAIDSLWLDDYAKEEEISKAYQEAMSAKLFSLRKSQRKAHQIEIENSIAVSQNPFEKWKLQIARNQIQLANYLRDQIVDAWYDESSMDDNQILALHSQLDPSAKERQGRYISGQIDWDHFSKLESWMSEQDIQAQKQQFEQEKKQKIQQAIQQYKINNDANKSWLEKAREAVGWFGYWLAQGAWNAVWNTLEFAWGLLWKWVWLFNKDAWEAISKGAKWLNDLYKEGRDASENINYEMWMWQAFDAWTNIWATWWELIASMAPIPWVNGAIAKVWKYAPSIAKIAQKYPTLAKIIWWATQWVIDTAKYQVVSDAELNKDWLSLWAAIGWALPAVWAVANKIWKVAPKLELNWLLNPAKLRNIKWQLIVEWTEAWAKNVDDVGRWMLERNMSWTKEQIIEKLSQHADDSKTMVDDLLAQTTEKFKSKDASNILKSLYDDLSWTPWLEAEAKALKQLANKKSFTLSELNQAKREMDKWYNIYKTDWWVWAGLKAKWLDSVRKSIKTTIETKADNLGLWNIRMLNNETQIANWLKKAIQEKTASDTTNQFMNLVLPWITWGIWAWVWWPFDNSTVQGKIWNFMFWALATKWVQSTKLKTWLAKWLWKLSWVEQKSLERYLTSGWTKSLDAKTAKKFGEIIQELWLMQYAKRWAVAVWSTKATEKED